MALPPKTDFVRPALSRTQSQYPFGYPAPPVTAPSTQSEDATITDAVLELSDGTAFRGISFGAEGKSVAGECVFQTGMSTILELIFTSDVDT